MRKICVNRKILDSSEDWMYDMISKEDKDLQSTKRHVKYLAKNYFIIFSIILCLFFVRILYLNYGVSNMFKKRSELNHQRTIQISALRGIIYDRNGKKLVQNLPKNQASIIPADIIKDKKERKNIFRKLSKVLDMDFADVESIYEKNKFVFQPVILKENIDHNTEIDLETMFANIPAIFVRRDFKREYLYDSTYSHLLGYVGNITDEEYKNNTENYSKDSPIGRMGIEEFYEDSLKGTDGQRTIIVNALGKLVSEMSFNNPIDGRDVTLTVDHNLQSLVYEALNRGIKRAKARAGSAIVLNPNNGEVLAMVSLSDFDPNIFNKYLTQEQWDEISSNQNYPFLNRSISGLYPPGSTFKLVTATGVLSENIVKSDDKIDSPGRISIQDKFNPTKQYIYKDWKLGGHGYLDIKEALAESSDTYFYKVTGGYEDFNGLGIEKFTDYCSLFGVGQKLEIDLPGEKAGLLPTPDWKLDTRGASWYKGDTYNMAIGQGYLLLTPLQVANFTSIVANGGKIFRPHLVNSKSNFLVSDNKLNSDHLEKVREGMRLAVTDKKGTARSMKYMGIEVAGKTGTAQFETNKREHAWFTMFAPYEKPEIVVTVLIEESGEGSTFALPVAREITEGFFN